MANQTHQANFFPSLFAATTPLPIRIGSLECADSGTLATRRGAALKSTGQRQNHGSTRSHGRSPSVTIAFIRDADAEHRTAPSHQPSFPSAAFTAPQPSWPMTTTTVQKWICESCGFIYDPAEGDPDGGIPPGTAFDDIPSDWFCPVCGARKADFSPYDE